MSTNVPELNGLAPLEPKFHAALNCYARLLVKADKGKLEGDELDILLHTGLRMRQYARELGLTRRQLASMLEKLVLYLESR